MAAARARDESADELRPLTSLFADVVGSTSLGERLDPHEVRALIGECVSRICAAVERYGGVVGAYMGDGIAAFFGLRTALEDDIERAARAALEIMRVTTAYSAEVAEAWGIEDFNVRVGINHGRVATGHVGAADPQHLALGDPVNVAARLQAAARPGTIVVGRSVAEALTTRYSLVSLGAISVKGKAENVEAYELSDEVASTDRLSFARFVGRDEEFDAISLALDDLADARGQIVVVTGEGGIGKTRLLTEARLRVAYEVCWLDARCDALDQGLGYEPFVQPLRSWLGVDVDSSAIAVRVRLAARGRQLLGDRFEEVAPDLARLLGVSLEPRLDQRLAGFPQDVLSANLYNSYGEWLCALGTAAPVVLAVDNLDVANEATATFASALLGAVREAPILVILAMRRTPSSPGWQTRVNVLANFSDRAQELQLKSLSVADAHCLVAALDEDRVLDARLRELVVSRADGNALYIEQLVQTMVQQSISENELPLALESLLLSRIDGLPLDARTVLQAAAVLGRTFRKDVLAGMSIASDLDAALGVLLSSEIIRERGRMPSRYAFQHGLIRDAALGTLTPAKLRTLHGLAAKSLSGRGVRDEPDVEAIARHHLAAGDVEHAIEALEGLAQRLALVFRYDEAISLLGRCLAETARLGRTREHVRLATRQADLLVATRKFETALVLLREVIALAHDDDERVELLLAKARAHTHAHEFDLADAALSEVLSWRSIGEAAMRARILRGHIGLETGNPRIALASVADLSLDASSPDLAFEIASVRAGAAALSGEFDTAESWALRAHEHAERSGSLAAQLTAKRHIALVLLLKGYVGEAHQLLTSVYRQYARLNSVAGQLETGVSLVHTSHQVGALREGIEIAEAVLALDLEDDWRSLLLVNLAVLKFEFGDIRDAATIAESILRSDLVGPRWIRVSAQLVVASVRISENEFDAAAKELSDALSEAAVSERPSDAVLVNIGLAEVYRRAGDLRRSAAFACAAREGVETAEEAIVLHVQRISSLVDAQSGNTQGRHDLETVVESARRMGLRLQEAHALLALGSLDPDNSEHHFAEAERIFRECECRRGLVELEEARQGVLISATS